MTAPRAVRTDSRARLAIFALATGAFGIGTAEFATMGLLPFIAEGLHASITEAGQAVSLYALGVVVGAPTITTLTAKMDRRVLLLCLMVVFVIGSLGSTFAPTMGTLLVARFVTGLPHGAFLGVASVIASRLVDPARKATAMARIMMGLTVANIFGVPAAAALGGHLGWRTAYGLVAAIGTLTVALIVVLVPKSAGAPGAGDQQPPSMRRELRALKRPQVILTLVAGSVGFGGMFAVYTYISPAMTEVAGLPQAAVPWVLVVYGLGMTTGSLIVGPLADRSIDRTSLLGIVLIGVVLVTLGAVMQLAVLAIICIFVMGVAGTIFTSALQVRLLRGSQDAPSLAAAMNHAAFNFANALGAFVGGLLIDAGLGYRSPAFVGAGLTAIGFIVILTAVLTRRHSVRTVIDLPAS